MEKDYLKGFVNHFLFPSVLVFLNLLVFGREPITILLEIWEIPLYLKGNTHTHTLIIHHVTICFVELKIADSTILSHF